MSWDIVSLGIAFLLGLAVGLVPWLVLSRRRSSEAGDAAERTAGRRRTLRLVAVSVGLTLLVVGGGTYAVLRVLLRSGPLGRVGAESVLRELRAEGPGAAAADAPGEPDRLGPPPAGVYTYAATGFYETNAPVFGKERRELPETIPAALRLEPDGWSLTVHYFDRHRTVFRWFSRPGKVLEEPENVTDNVRFGFEVRTTTTCAPPEILRGTIAPGTTWDQDCRSVTTGLVGAAQDLTSKTTLVGVESLEIGGTPVEAWHVHRDTVVSSGQTGTLVRDVWFAVRDGMLLRMDVESRTSGLADHVESNRLVLASLVPEQ